jgi:hypothetical protein
MIKATSISYHIRSHVVFILLNPPTTDKLFQVYFLKEIIVNESELGCDVFRRDADHINECGGTSSRPRQRAI